MLKNQARFLKILFGTLKLLILVPNNEASRKITFYVAIFWLWWNFGYGADSRHVHLIVTLCFVTIEVHSVNLESYISMSLLVNCMSDSLRNVASRTLWTLFYVTIISSELLREYLKEKNSVCSHSPLKLLITVTCNNAWVGIPKCNCHLKFFPLQKCSGCNENGLQTFV